MADLPVAEQTLVGRVTGGHVDDLPFATVTESLGLGKYVAVGYGGNPTWIDPAATDWADVEANNFGWVQFAYGKVGDAVDVRVGRGDGTVNLRIAINAAGFMFVQAVDAGGQLTFGPGYLTLDDSTHSFLDIQADGSVGGVTPSVGNSIKWDGTKAVWA